ncbi:MAG TPA: hypothetical protein VNN80_03440 [Polyangiaceae bacterium]|nr:hypothetical protein [Polyangiaceae bacterium]
MNIVRFSSAVALALAITACSEDDESTPASTAAANQPAGGRGGSAGGTAAAAAGRGGAPATASGGASAEAPDDDIDLEPGDDDDDTSGASNGGAASADGDAGAGPSPVADAGSGADGDTLDDGTMTFFVTSTGMGDGGNLGGLEGADAFCEQLAVAQSADFARRTWHAYLSTSTVNAIDRIGAGPWRNADGVIVANSSAQLHDPANVAAGGPLDATWAINDLTIPLDETGAQVPAGGAGGVQHDILTGTLLDGTVVTNETCLDWTSNADDPNISARVGHSNRTGLAGQRQLWNDVHTVGCSQAGMRNVTQGGGRGSFYCFAVITGE